MEKPSLGIIAETIEGCAAILEELEEERRDPRLRTAISSLSFCQSALDSLDDTIQSENDQAQ